MSLFHTEVVIPVHKKEIMITIPKFHTSCTTTEQCQQHVTISCNKQLNMHVDCSFSTKYKDLFAVVAMLGLAYELNISNSNSK